MQLLGQHPEFVGNNLDSVGCNNTYYTIFDISGGETLDHLSRENLTLRKLAARMISILEGLQIFHSEGLLHCDISPDNILIVPYPRHEIAILIDYNSVTRVEEWQANRLPPCSIKPAFASPEVKLRKNKEISYPSDLYSITCVFFYELMMGRKLRSDEQQGFLRVTGV